MPGYLGVNVAGNVQLVKPPSQLADPMENSAPYKREKAGAALRPVRENARVEFADVVRLTLPKSDGLNAVSADVKGARQKAAIIRADNRLSVAVETLTSL